jgi:hypothetical protein
MGREMARLAGLVALIALALPAGARADHVFVSGQYAGATGQERELRFAADHSGVHVFRARLRLTCPGGERRIVRVSVPHVEQLDDDTGRFSYVRRSGDRVVLRLTGTLAATYARGTVSRRVGRCGSGTRNWTAERRGGAGRHHPPEHGGGGGQPHGESALTRLGNRAPYPAPERASAPNVRRAEALRVATNGAAARFATVALAEAAGYVADPAISPIHRPGLVHYRKGGPRFWGRLLEPRAPQALVFWCPSAGECALAAFMYRALPRLLPPTYGHILGWHRHDPADGWMTHVWLTGDVRTAFAQCAPFPALSAHNPALAYESYEADIPGLDEPCATPA